MFQISAQESRRKKKEYMDTLEKRMELLNNEVDKFRQRCSFLEQQNGALQMQLQKLQAQLSAAAVTTSSSKSFSTPANKTSLASQVMGDHGFDYFTLLFYFSYCLLEGSFLAEMAGQQTALNGRAKNWLEWHGKKNNSKETSGGH